MLKANSCRGQHARCAIRGSDHFDAFRGAFAPQNFDHSWVDAFDACDVGLGKKVAQNALRGMRIVSKLVGAK